MRRLDDGNPPVRCLLCGRVREDGEGGWRSFSAGDQVVHICDRHVEAFTLGMEWAERRRQATTTAEESTQRDEERDGRRRRIGLRLQSILDFDITPKRIHAELSRRVAGQSAAKRTLATAVRGHYSRVQARMADRTGERTTADADSLPRESVLLLGPTGCGKSFTCRSLSRIVNVPFWRDSMTKYTEDGYVGNSADELLSSLITVSDGYIPLAEKGMLFLDEIDKKATQMTRTGFRDVSGEGVQMALLEMLDTDGTTVFVCPSVGGRRNPNQQLVEFNTGDVFFILGGAFVGLADIISRRIGGRRRRLGFGGAVDRPVDMQLRESELLHEIEPEDLIEYGLIPELVGRIGGYAVFDPLTIDDLRHIMLDVEDAVVRQQQARAAIEGFSLEFDDEAIDSICRRAYESGMGARRLRSITSQTLAAVFFENTVQRRRGGALRVVVTADTVDDPDTYEVVRPPRAKARVRKTIEDETSQLDPSSTDSDAVDACD